MAVDGNVVRGLVINRFGALGDSNEGGAGISIQSANNIIEGNYIGTDVSGTVAQPNRTDGIQIDHPGNRVGGTTAAARNVISGNAGSGIVLFGPGASTTIQGNIIGLDVTGTARLGNVSQGIVVESANNVIGGDVAAAGNVISGNGRYGVVLNFAQASGNIIAGNLIGTNGSGTGAIGNTLDGVYIPSAGNRIGGTLPVSRNVISGNGGGGVVLGSVDASLNRVEGNYIGTDVTGTINLGNLVDGVTITGPNNTVGGADSSAANVIAFNGRTGVHIQYGALGNRVSGNSVFNNVYLGIDLIALGGLSDGVTPNDSGDGDTGANNLQNFPVLVA